MSNDIDLESKHAIGNLADAQAILDNQPLSPAPEYRQRHIVTLKPVTKWSKQDIAYHKKHNRILQAGYGTLSADKAIQLSIRTKQDWLTDWVCPQIRPAYKLNIAADLVTFYQIPAEELNEKTQAIFQWIEKNDPKIFQQDANAIQQELTQHTREIQAAAEQQMKKHYPELFAALQPNAPSANPALTSIARLHALNIFKDFVTIETQRKQKQITHQRVSRSIQMHTSHIAAAFNLLPKPEHELGSNRDHVFLGAAGSGKSTLAKSYLNSQDKLESIVLATDDYRGVTLDPCHEKVQTEQVFIKTQDTAYSIKELVQQRLENKSGQRPNIIVDCMTLEGWHRKLLATSQHGTISTIACLDDVSLVPERAYWRALDNNSGPADKGRQYNTTDLLTAHREASKKLLHSLPAGVASTLYDTNVEKDQLPRRFAIVDLTGDKHEIIVNNLSKLARFACKANVNIDAEYPSQLYRDKKHYQLTFNEHHQAEQLLFMVKSDASDPHRVKPAYDMVLTHGDLTYAKTIEKNGKCELQVLDAELFNKIWENKDKHDGRVLRSLLMQIYYGSLTETKIKIKELGSEYQAEEQAMLALTSGMPRIEPSSGFDLHLITLSTPPSLESLHKRFGGLDENGKIKPLTVLPLLIKDQDGKIWIYGRAANGAPQLNKLPDISKFIPFSKNKEQLTLLSSSAQYRPLYQYLIKKQFHYPNHTKLRDDERERRIAEMLRLTKEYERQYQQLLGKLEQTTPSKSMLFSVYSRESKCPPWPKSATRQPLAQLSKTSTFLKLMKSR